MAAFDIGASGDDLRPAGARRLTVRQLGVAYRTARKAIFLKGVEFRDPSQRLLGRTRPDKQATQ